MDFLGDSLSRSVLTVLPDDVITDIMTRLPVKSLLRFKCVSKRFCALVDSPYLIRKHHNHALKSKTNHKIILHSLSNYYHSTDLYCPGQALKLELPLNSDIRDCISGSVHGLLCIHVNAKGIVIWNPSTKKYQIIPEAFSYDIEDYNYSTFHGFGYEPDSDDYKILTINQFWIHSSYKCKTAVYNLRSNSWQFIKDCPYRFRCHFDNERYGTLICGELLWCVSNSNGSNGHRSLIATFDLATNNFSLVAHPDALNDEFLMTNSTFSDFSISELGGDLCVIGYYMGHRVDVWVMTEYRVKESWTKLYSIPKIHGRFYFPIAYSKKGDEIMSLIQGVRLFWYNLKENVPRNIEVRECPYGVFQIVICVESLAPPNGRWRED